MDETAKAQARANQNTENGLRQERLKNAIEHLGFDSDSVRLGGAYELFHLSEDTKDLRQTVLDILCAHIRWTTGEIEYREKHRSKPSEEIQSLLTLLFVQEHKVFKGLPTNLQGSWLNGAKLSGARLQSADLAKTYLQGASLHDADLHGVFLTDAQLHGAYLVGARLHGAYLYRTQLPEANLGRAQLPGADLFDVQLQGANLAMVELQGAILINAQLQEAHLLDTQVCGVGCEEDLSDTFAERMMQLAGKESGLSRTIFAGGLTREDVDSSVKGLSDEEANRLREKLEPHIEKPPSNQLPEDSDALIGTYTAEEAEQWIAEYEEAVFAFDERDDK